MMSETGLGHANLQDQDQDCPGLAFFKFIN